MKYFLLITIFLFISAEAITGEPGFIDANLWAILFWAGPIAAISAFILSIMSIFKVHEKYGKILGMFLTLISGSLLVYWSFILYIFVLFGGTQK